jgi:hypothetical protein
MKEKRLFMTVAQTRIRPMPTYTEEEYLQMEIEEELDACKDSCAHFIKNWVYIEDKDKAGSEEGIATKFAMWPLQAEALATFMVERLLVILKARQLGVTWLALAYAVWRLLFQAGYTVVALSKKEDPDAKELVRRVSFILQHLPVWMCMERTQENKEALKRYSGPTWEATTLKVTIYHPGQEPSVFTSMAAAADSGRSFTANLVLLDEWAYQQWAAEIFDSAYPTINRPTGGQVIGLSTNKRGSFFEAICKRFEDFGFVRIFLPWWTDPRRTKEWYEASKKALPHSYRQEYPATPEEAMSAGEGTAFPEWTETIHVCKPFTIPSWWRRWRSNDPGYADPFAFYWFAVSPDGIVYMYREYTRAENDPRVTYSDQAREVVRLSVMDEKDQDGKPVPEQFSFTVVGRDAWNKLGRALGSSDGKSIIDCYQEGGLHGCIEPPRDTKTDRILRKAIMHEYLKPFEDERTGRTIAKLQVFSTCSHFIEAMPNLVVDENDHEKVALDPHVYTNPYDAAGYGLVAWHLKKSKVPEPEKTTVQKDKERLAKLRKRPRRFA